MGWIGYVPSHFTKGGNVNRKAECDAYFLEGPNKGHFNALKSVMKGSVYYAAIKNMVRYNRETKTYEPIDDGIVLGVVFSYICRKRYVLLQGYDRGYGSLLL